MAQPMMHWVNVSLSSRLFIVFSVSSVSLCPLCLKTNPSTTFLHDIVARCWTLCSTPLLSKTGSGVGPSCADVVCVSPNTATTHERPNLEGIMQHVQPGSQADPQA